MEQAIAVEVYGLTPVQSWALFLGLAYLTWRAVQWYVSNKL
jgi:hypothetical protein